MYPIVENVPIYTTHSISKGTLLTLIQATYLDIKLP
jgi:hypothetical protein